MELPNQLPGSHSLIAPVNPQGRDTGHPELGTPEKQIARQLDSSPRQGR